RALASYTAMGFGVAIDDVGTRHSNLETVMSLRPHFIKISDVLVRGIARSTVKREMLRSLRHIAETIDAVMIAEGIEHQEDVVAIRELGLRYGQGYYMARPGPAFPSLPDYVRAELRSATIVTPKPLQVARDAHDEDDEDDEDNDDRELAIPMASGTATLTAVPRNVFGKPEDEITSDFALPGVDNRRPRASQPPEAPSGSPPSPTVPPWQPLSDDEATGEALLASIKRPGAENAPGGESGRGGPGLN
ncbi:MAG: EAL domain-containing protein, partial [Acidobacteriota bacterium]